MKIPKARKLQSGKWNIRVQIDGNIISITKPTEKACIAAAVAVKTGQQTAKKETQRATLTAAIDSYIENREHVLSPSTIRGYRKIQSGRFQQMMHRVVSDVTADQWQRAVNLEAKLCSAKTLTNAWRFLGSVIYEQTGVRVSVRLPQIVKAERPWLTPDEIPKFVQAIHGHSIEIPALLALSSLRRSEILALRWDHVDLEQGLIHVSGAAVYDSDGHLVQKVENKNRSSARLVPIIPPLRDALQAAERTGDLVCTLNPAGMYAHINRCCVAAGLPKVGIHGLRHSFASLAYHLGMPEKVAMQIGGWSDSQTMHDIYTHISQSDVAKYAVDMANFYRSQCENWNEKLE